MNEGALADASLDAVVRADLRDLFAAAAALGGVADEYSVAEGAVVRAFRRGPEWREALARVRQLLKKYHAHEALPARRALAAWRVLRDKLLPLLRSHSDDRCVARAGGGGGARRGGGGHVGSGGGRALRLWRLWRLRC